MPLLNYLHCEGLYATLFVSSSVRSHMCALIYSIVKVDSFFLRWATLSCNPSYCSHLMHMDLSFAAPIFNGRSAKAELVGSPTWQHKLIFFQPGKIPTLPNSGGHRTKFCGKRKQPRCPSPLSFLLLQITRIGAKTEGGSTLLQCFAFKQKTWPVLIRVTQNRRKLKPTRVNQLLERLLIISQNFTALNFNPLPGYPWHRLPPPLQPPWSLVLAPSCFVSRAPEELPSSFRASRDHLLKVSRV